MSLEPHTELEVIGNRDLVDRLLRDIRAGQLSHAYILEGRKGSGRHTLARFICASVACQNRPGSETRVSDSDQIDAFALLDDPPKPREIPADAPLPCGVCAGCRKVIEGKHPDITVIGREGKATIGVDAVRFLRQDVLIPPNDGDTKIYIIEDADCLTVQAQNALLLTLEEPPPYVLFLLLCDGDEALLETIRSRAPVLHTQPIPDEDIRAYIRKKRCSLSEDDLSAAILRADGCIGQAVTLSDARSVKPILKMRAQADAFIGACTARRTDTMPAVLAGFGNKRDAVLDILSLVSLALRDLILLRHCENVRLKYYTDREAAADMAYRFTTRRLLGMDQALSRAAAALSANANIRLTLMQLAVDTDTL